MYKKALAGEIKGFTGIDDPFDEPSDPEIICDTDKETAEESAEKIVKYLREKGYLPAPGAANGEGSAAQKQAGNA